VHGGFAKKGETSNIEGESSNVRRERGNIEGERSNIRGERRKSSRSVVRPAALAAES